MEPNNYDQRLDNIAASLFKGSNDGSSDGGSGNDLLNNLKGILGDTFSEENLRGLGNQIKSTFNEHINEENLSNLGEEIKSMFQDNLNQDQINKVLNYAKGTLGSEDKTGKVSGLIQCLQNDINDPTCFEMDGNTSAHSTAFSIQVKSNLKRFN